MVLNCDIETLKTVFNRGFFVIEFYRINRICRICITPCRKSTEFRWICLFTLDFTQEIYIPSDSQDTSLQTFTHILSLEVKLVEILTDLN